MAEKNSRERPFALRNDQIRRDRSSLWAGVGNVVKSPSVELFDYLVMDIERRLGVIIEKVQCSLVIGRCPGAILGNRYKRFGHDLCHLSDRRLSIVRRRC
jgi:hypothetical protein